MFLTSMALWLVSVAVTYATGNANLIPAIVLLGSFLVPEVVKLFTLAFLTRHLVVKSVRDGMILDATVGLGFAGSGQRWLRPSV
jgi:RsiW-degrading membrane proteinase PrsW (M82 family)